MPFILGANTLSTGAYEVANSCRFNDDDSAHMHVTRGSAGNQKTFTISMWIKRCKLGASNYFFTVGPDGDTNFVMYFDASDQLEVWEYKSSAYQFRLKPKHKFRDTTAWYHLCVAFDTTQATDTNRIKIYVNGTQLTEFDTTNWPSEDYDTLMNDDRKYWLGKYTSLSYYYDGYLAEVVVLDGTAASPTSFGEFNEDSPTIWQPIDVSGLTFGTNGFYLDFEDSSNLGNDANGGTDWTESGLAAADQATDSCTNNFAVMNSLDNYYANSTFSEGNLKLVQGSSTYAHNLSTIAVTAGKWYVEAKLTTDSEHALVGITDTPPVGTGTKILGSGAYDYSIKQSNGDLFNNRGDDPANDATDYAAAYAQNDIIGIALDITNSKLYFSKGGAWSDGSGSWDSTTFDAAVGAITITAPASTNNGHYFFASGDYGSASCTWEWNFGGCPAFSISSGNADGNGYGNFEYSVPSGFLALCTKNLGSDGG
jgi:hypothetical protein